MADTPDEITALLRQAQAADPVVTEFAWVWLEAFRRDVIGVLQLHRQEGRSLANRDQDPLRRRTEERLERARRRLRDRLRRIVGRTGESGRAGK